VSHLTTVLGGLYGAWYWDTTQPNACTEQQIARGTYSGYSVKSLVALCGVGHVWKNTSSPGQINATSTVTSFVLSGW
jgi:hypothetical protein